MSGNLKPRKHSQIRWRKVDVMIWMSMEPGGAYGYAAVGAPAPKKGGYCHHSADQARRKARQHINAHAETGKIRADQINSNP